MHCGIGFGTASKRQTLLSTTTERKLWKYMITNILNGHGTYKNNYFSPIENKHKTPFWQCQFHLILHCAGLHQGIYDLMTGTRALWMVLIW